MENNNTTGSSFRRLKALIIKEFYQMIRDPSSILISIVLPLILIFIYGYGVSLDINHLRIGVVNEDNSAEAVSLVESFRNSRFFDVKLAHNQEAFVEDVTRGDLRGFVVIPSYFSAFSKRPDNIAPIQVIADGSEPNTANFVVNYVRGAWQVWLRQQQIEKGTKSPPLVNIEARFWFNEELESRNFLVPGSLGIIMTMIGTLLTALVVSREWERGTMEALMSTPVTIPELLFGKLIPYFLLGMFTMIICFIITVFVYQVPFRGSFIVLFFVSGVFLISALATGLFISTVAKNQFVASQAAMLAAFLPAFMLSGFIFEIASMPKIIQWFTLIIPARYYISCLQTLFLAGNVWSLILYNLVPMSLVAAFFLFLAFIRSQKRLE